MIKPLIIVVVYLHFFLLLFSFSTIITTILIYVLGTYAVISFLKHLESKRKASYLHYKVFFLATSATLFVGELSLRYVFKTNLSYSEQNGLHLYASPFFSNKVVRLIGLSGAEIDLSGIDKYRVKRERTESISDEFSYVHSFNSLGCRGAEPLQGEGVFKILALGDSFTEGAGTPEDSTWVHLLSLRMQDHQDQKTTYLNAGISGSDPFQSFQLLKRLHALYKPDLVVLLLNYSDINQDFYNRGGKERFEKGSLLAYRVGPWWEPIYASSFIFRAIIHATTNMDYLFCTPEDRMKNHEEASWAIANLLQTEYTAFAAENNIDFRVFSIPYEFELKNNYDAFAELDSVLQHSNVKFINLYPALRQYVEENELNYSDLYWTFDMHFKPVGYSVVADLMFGHLKKSLVNTN
jgi:lysophospholipase L1-like esterase